MLDKELTRILDIKEETDQQLIEAYKQIAELEAFKNQISLLLVFITNHFKSYIDYRHFIINLIVLSLLFRNKLKVKIE